MNMEDRLRQAFDDEADQMRAPGGSIEDAIRRGKHRRTSRFIGGAALALTLIGGTAVAIQLGAGNGDDPEEIIATNENQVTTTTLATTINTPVAQFDWERVALPVPAGTEVYNLQVQSIAGRFVAVGEGFSPGLGDNQRLVWVSDNGHDWTLDPGPGSSGKYSGGEVFGSDGGIIVVERGSLPNQTTVVTSSDGLAWARGVLDLSDSLADGQFVYFSGGASGNGVHILAGIAEYEPPQPPVILEQAGIVLQEQPGTGFATVSGLETGEIITQISVETLYGGRNPDGVPIYDAAGDVVVVIPWDIHDQAYQVHEGMPGVADPDEVVIEYGGVRLTLNEPDYTYVATDIAAGSLISEGDQEVLYQPQVLRIVHPETFDVIVDMPIEDFWLAREESYSNFDYGDIPGSEAVILRSEDGINWAEVDLGIPSGQAIQISGITYGASGFLMQTFVFGADGGDGIWQSPDGLNWTPTADPGRFAGQTFTAVNGSYYSVGTWNGANPGIYRSDDTDSWDRVYAFELNSIWLNSLASGDLGLVATGQDQRDYLEPPLVVSKGDKTMVLDTSSGSVIVTDDVTSEVLANITFDIYDEGPPVGIVVSEDDDGFQIFDTEDRLVMTITEAEMEAVLDEQGPDEYYYPEPVVVFSPNGDDWRRVSTNGLDVAYMSGVAVGANVVVISGDPIYDLARGSSQGSVSVELDGQTGTTLVYSDGSVSSDGPPPPFVWVGTPR